MITVDTDELRKEIQRLIDNRMYAEAEANITLLEGIEALGLVDRIELARMRSEAVFNRVSNKPRSKSYRSPKLARWTTEADAILTDTLIVKGLTRADVAIAMDKPELTDAAIRSRMCKLGYRIDKQHKYYLPTD